ncbi:trafficking protein particle complex subunit 6A isoform X3 [Lemur catta]|uniref:trafficking protein particle complex subunit 6A isoform X3 n=1 Tax=Lemur catta TaxID=9447 RepID=UPI001E2671AB|nr:trafficking protein particle complex subunit 6A isoform X3 [Lemur catta]
MAGAGLFVFLHAEMVAELGARDTDPGPGGQKRSLSVLEGTGFRVGQALGESSTHQPGPSVCPAPQAAPGDAGLQGGAGCPKVPVQRPVGGRVPKTGGRPVHQPPGKFQVVIRKS